MLKDGNFVPFKDINFKTTLIQLEQTTCNVFYWVCQNFLGNKKGMLYKYGIKNLLNSYLAVGCYLSLIVHLMDPRLDFFPKSHGTVSDEHSKQFHHEVSAMEKRYHVSGMMTVC